MKTAGTWSAPKVNQTLFHLSGCRGITGTTTINRATGDHDNPPLVMQLVESSGHYVVSQKWLQHGSLPSLPSL